MTASDFTLTLTTPRLRLRPHRADDLEACLELWQDPVVTRHTSGQPLSRQEERQSGRFIGEVGLGRFKRDVLADHPELSDIPETGWVMLPWAHGRGYAHEAVAAVLEWRDAQLPTGDTFCLIDPENMPSLRLAERLGFQELDRVGGGQTVLLLRPGPDAP